MFPTAWFPDRYFAPRYWAKLGEEDENPPDHPGFQYTLKRQLPHATLLQNMGHYGLGRPPAGQVHRQ